MLVAIIEDASSSEISPNIPDENTSMITTTTTVNDRTKQEAKARQHYL